MGLDILYGNPSAGGFANPQSLRIWIPTFFFENMDSRIPQLKDSGNPNFYGIGRSFTFIFVKNLGRYSYWAQKQYFCVVARM